MQQKIEYREGRLWPDLLRSAAAFGIILLHVAADVITEWGKVPASWWWSAHVYDTLTRGCVLIFIMVSGALLLPKSESAGDFFRKRFRRVAIPFAVWIVIYLIWKKHFYVPGMDWAAAGKRILAGDIHFHLWFIYSITGLYLLTPVFRILAAHADKKQLIYFLTLCFAAASLLPTLSGLIQVLTGTRIYFKTDLEPAEGMIGFFVLGFFIRRYAADFSLRWIQFAVGASFLACLLGMWGLCLKTGHYVGILYEPISPNSVFYAAGIFAWVLSRGDRLDAGIPAVVQKILPGLADASLGIYLIHPMILDALIKGRLGFTLSGLMDHPLWMIPLTALAVYAASFLITWLIQRVPYLRNIV